MFHKKNWKSLILTLCCILIPLALILSGFCIISHQTKQVIENPIKGINPNRNFVMLSAGERGKLQIFGPSHSSSPQHTNTPNHNIQNSDKHSDKISVSQKKETNSAAPSATFSPTPFTKVPTTKKQQKLASTTNTTALPSSMPSQTPPDKQTNHDLIAPSPVPSIQPSSTPTPYVENKYFTTTIKDYETVSTKQYNFHIIQYKNNLNVKNTEVFVNQTIVKQFHETVLLQEGENTIKIQVTYENPSDGSLFQISKTYHIKVQLDAPVIDTTLVDHTIVKEKELTFQAHAFENGKELALSAVHNDQKLSISKDTYHLSLENGKNLITLSAVSSEGKSTSKQYEITYQPSTEKIMISTSLTNQTITTSSLRFTASAALGQDEVPISLTCNDAVLSPLKGHQYEASLKKGKNTIQMTASKGGTSVYKSFTVKYTPIVDDTNPDDESDDSLAPKLITDLKDHSTVTGNIRTFYIKPVDHNGERIYGDNVTVTCNGSPVKYTWDDSTKTSYKLTLKSGENIVIIVIKDSENRKKTTTFHITCNCKQDGDVIGTATFSIEATTIGLGYLIPPTKVELHQGEKATYVLDQLLKKNNFTYQKNGTSEASFYLSALEKENLVVNPSIPNDLKEHLEKAHISLDLDSYQKNKLGEMDFTPQSGWMYSVNGDYPNYGFADCYLTDGDVIRIRYTLALGRDIGGGSSLGKGDDGNWEKEW
ncbi:hypothetical protein lbkm_0335 [Lachnospiraceae bacterium KM106-2]|nr:hypothetical protein lbkm_0335 [Lachnospiraceae bacterium KM106-2]